jgi:hypothetical protein
MSGSLIGSSLYQIFVRLYYYTLAEYFDIIKANDERYEYRDGEIVLMSGGSKNHAQIMVNLTDSLARQLKGCRVIPADVPLKTSHQPFRSKL